jgi:hypothetical protein
VSEIVLDGITKRHQDGTTAVAGVAIGDAEPDAAEIEEVPQIPAIIARLDPRTAIREGQPAQVHVDLGSLHFFDPDTGDSLRD